MTDETTIVTELKPASRKAEIPEGYVRARVLPLGDGKIFTGECVEFGHSPAERFPTHKKGDVIVTERRIAEAQERAGRMEIL